MGLGALKSLYDISVVLKRSISSSQCQTRVRKWYHLPKARKYAGNWRSRKPETLPNIHIRWQTLKQAKCIKR
jgi:hypothetical protein